MDNASRPNGPPEPSTVDPVILDLLAGPRLPDSMTEYLHEHFGGAVRAAAGVPGEAALREVGVLILLLPKPAETVANPPGLQRRTS